MKPITVFTWGYYGWGNHTPQLVKAIDAVEMNRGSLFYPFVTPISAATPPIETNACS